MTVLAPTWTRVGCLEDIPLLEGRSTSVEGRQDRDLPAARRPGGDRRPLPARRRPAARRHRRRLVRHLPAARAPLRPHQRRGAQRARRASPSTRSRSATGRSGCGLPETRTTCPYCGVGCGLVATVEDGRLTAVRGDKQHPVNQGATCRKPTRLPEAVHAPDRATTPMWRASADERWRTGSWRAVIASIARKLTDVKPDEIAFYISGQLLTEDYYAVNKLAKGFLGTNNVDSNSRLCMSSAVAGYTGALGSRRPAAVLRRHRRGRVRSSSSAPTPRPAIRSSGTGSAPRARS